MNGIKDFIYLDMEKVSSLYSQLTGGIIQTVETLSSSSENNKNLRNYNLKIFKHEAGGVESNTSQLKETRISHHEIYNELERELFLKGYTAEIGVDIMKEHIENDEATLILENALCVKVEGRIVFEDYEKLMNIADNHNEIIDFINNSIVVNLNKKQDVIDIKNLIQEKKEIMKTLKRNQERNQQKDEILELEKTLNLFLDNSKTSKVEEWITSGLKKWIKTFLSNIFTMRLYPFSDLDDFHIMSNLKKDSFIENNLESIHYLFGSKPTLKVSMLGIITSIPKKDEDDFLPMNEFENEENLSDKSKFESAFRGVFRGFDGLEDLIRTCRYPRIMVQPIAIYREVKPNNNLKRE